MLGSVQMFEAAGAEALVAFSGDEALQILEQRSDIKLVYTDCLMPGTLGGLELAQAVRDRWPTVELMVVSGQVHADLHDLPMGCRFFPKPVSQVQISQTLIELGVVGPGPRALTNFPSKLQATKHFG